MKTNRFLFAAICLAITSTMFFACSSDDPGGGCKSPPAPSAVTVPLSQSSIKISWTSVDAASSYKVYRKGSPNETYKPLGTVLGTTFTDTGLVSGATYYYGISAENDCGEGATSNAVSETTLDCPKPAIPVSVFAEPLSTTSIRIAWQSVPDAASYNIYRSATQDGAYSESIASTESNSFTHIGLLPATANYYKIVAINGCGESKMSSYASAITNSCPAPAAPANVTAATKSSTSIEISWDAVNTAVSYQIYRSTSAAGTYVPVGITTGRDSTSYTDTGLPSAETFYYRVAALSDCAESAQSSPAFASTICDLIPPPPTGVTAEALSSNEVKVSWNPVSGASRYNVYYASSPDGNYLRAGWLSSYYSTFTASNMKPEETYYFRVTAANNCGEESEKSTSYGSATTVDCDLPIPPAPTGIAASTSFARSVNITWDNVDGAAFYWVYRNTERNGTYSSVGGRVTGTSLKDTTVSALTTYYYTVKSINACGGRTEYLDGDIVSVTTLCETSVPTNVAATPRSSSSLEIAWDAVSGAVSYSVYRASGNPNGAYTLLGKVASNSFTDTGLTSLTTYYYKITAKTELCDDSNMSVYESGTTQ